MDACGKSRPLSGFDPQTAQPVASRSSSKSYWNQYCFLLYFSEERPISVHTRLLLNMAQKTSTFRIAATLEYVDYNVWECCMTA